MRALVTLAVILPLAGGAMAGTFLSVAEDVPLAPGLAERPGALVFDKPGGRIVEAEAGGSVGRAVVERFYRDSLPQLGWRAATSRVYERDAERLELSFSGQGGALVVHFAITPR